MSYGTCGSLFSGIGLLDFGLHLASWEHRWLCESDEWRRSVLRKRFPGAVVFDDVRTLRGEAATDAAGSTNGADTGTSRRSTSADGEAACGLAGRRVAAPVTLLAGGFPCKGASTAGKREGFEHAETVLWAEMRRLVGELGPRYVLIENVANILGMAASPSEPAGSLWGTVLADLAALGFDVVWDCVPAAAVGAPHLRDRVFAVATANAAREPQRAAVHEAHAVAGGGDARALPRVGGAEPGAAADAARHGEGRSSAQGGSDGQRTGPRADDAADAAPTGRGTAIGAGQQRGVGRDAGAGGSVAVEWGDYGPAIERWEAIHGTAPEPLIRRLDDGDAKLRRMRARVDRSRLSALGDGVHVYVGWLAGEYIAGLERERVAA